jgi:hypothetical protein
MDANLEERLKHRDIRFDHGGPQEPAQVAKLLLRGIEGIVDVVCINSLCLSVHYDIEHLNLRSIEEALTEVGFALDQGLFITWRRALIYYIEETQRLNLGLSQKHSKSTTEIFINRYNQLQHGCRDDRPEYYHHYN